MDATELKLANLVREHPNLYDQSQPDYKDNLRGHLSWKEIAGVMEMSEGEVRVIWKNLRDKFCKAKKRLAKRNFILLDNITGKPVEKFVPKLYCQMDWLSAHVQLRTEKSPKDTGKDGGIDDVEKEQTKDKKEQLNPLPVVTTILSPADSSPSSLQTIESSFKHKKTTSTQTNPPADALRDEDELFLLSLLPSLKRLNIKKKMELRIKFQQVIYAAEFEN